MTSTRKASMYTIFYTLAIEFVQRMDCYMWTLLTENHRWEEEKERWTDHHRQTSLVIRLFLGGPWPRPRIILHMVIVNNQIVLDPVVPEQINVKITDKIILHARDPSRPSSKPRRVLNGSKCPYWQSTVVCIFVEVKFKKKSYIREIL